MFGCFVWCVGLWLFCDFGLMLPSLWLGCGFGLFRFLIVCNEVWFGL